MKNKTLKSELNVLLGKDADQPAKVLVLINEVKDSKMKAETKYAQTKQMLDNTISRLKGAEQLEKQSEAMQSQIASLQQ